MALDIPRSAIGYDRKGWAHVPFTSIPALHNPPEFALGESEFGSPPLFLQPPPQFDRSHSDRGYTVYSPSGHSAVFQDENSPPPTYRKSFRLPPGDYSIRDQRRAGSTSSFSGRLLPTPRTSVSTSISQTSMSPMKLGNPALHIAAMPARFRGGVSDDSLNDSMQSFENIPGARGHTRCALPSCALDPSGAIAVTFQQIIDGDIFEMFVKDKTGCHFMQENYPEKETPLRSKLFKIIDAKDYFFEELAKDVFANFFVQKMLEKSTPAEQDWITSKIHNNMFSLCLNRYSCRVIQKAFEILADDQKALLIKELHYADLTALTVDQNANHVIQKILTSFELPQWAFIVVNLMSEENFFCVVENKYGCRVIQLAIELLANGHTPKVRDNHCTVRQMLDSGVDVSRFPREALLQETMEILLSNCERLSSNEFANYVVQHVITTPALAEFRDQIIERCLMGKLLSLSQEKFASHVVEKAMNYASPHLLREMMDEIFDGYVPHPETKKDALDILLFHQYGNYVIQRMLKLCTSDKSGLNAAHRYHWLMRLQERISRNTSKLQKYSSGKKIIDMLIEAGMSTRISTYRL